MKSRRRLRWWLAFGVLAVIVAAAYAAGAGRSERADPWRTGSAYVGDHLASIRVDGWAYGVADSVAWTDTSGSLHDSGWPSCLGPAGSSVHVRFKAAPVSAPDGSGVRVVTLVDCRDAS